MSADNQNGKNVTNNLFDTVQFGKFDKSGTEVEKLVASVMKAMTEKGYNPVNQLVGFIISGDPTYVTSYGGARSLIMKMDRDLLLEEIVQFYLDNNIKLRNL